MDADKRGSDSLKFKINLRGFIQILNYHWFSSASIRVHLTKDLIIKFVYVRFAPIVVALFF